MGNIRRSRGYAYEMSIVKRFQAKKGGDARRLGGSSTGLPDVMATIHIENTHKIYSCEAKSSRYDLCFIPIDQIQRCYAILGMFAAAYNEMWVMFAFGFKNQLRGKRREPKEYLFLVDYNDNEKYKLLNDCDKITCNYKGILKIFPKNSNKGILLKLKKFVL